MKIETRAGSKADLNTESDTSKVQGYASVFNSRANIGGMFYEEFLPGAFSQALREDDVVFLVNHGGLPLARTSSGTLTLSEDDHGLQSVSDLDNSDPDVQAIVPKMRRGDLNKMSIGFFPIKQEWDDSGDLPLRRILQAGLDDVSIVNRPAFEATEIALRSYQEFRDSKPKIFDCAVLRTRMKMNLTLRSRLASGSR